MNRDAEYTEILRGRLTERRFIHSLNVADSAKELAEIYGYDPAKAYTAGLIHDCCKDEPAGLQLSYMLGNGAALTDCEINTAKPLSCNGLLLYLNSDAISTFTKTSAIIS